MQSAPSVHLAFVALAPRLVAVARFHFRHVRCPDTRADCLAETLALCWHWFVGLADQGREPHTFASALARFAALAVKSGRKLTGSEKATEPLSSWTRSRRRFTVRQLETAATSDNFDDAIADNAVTPVPAQVQFRLDFPAWRNRLPASRRAVVDLLAAGYRTEEVARAVGLSPARVSQLRRELHASYHSFCDGRQTDEPADVTG